MAIAGFITVRAGATHRPLRPRETVMTALKLPPKRLFLLVSLAVLALLSGGVAGHLLAPRPPWNPNLPGQVQLAAARVLDAPAVRYRGSVDGGLVSFDVTMTEHGEGYGVATTSNVRVELMLVDGVTLVKGDDAYWDNQSDRLPYPDEWVRVSSSLPTYVDLTALTPAAVTDAVAVATRDDVQLQIVDWGWQRNTRMTFAATGNGTAMYLQGSGRLTQVAGSFGRLGSEVRIDVRPVDHATAMATYNTLIQVTQQQPGYIDVDLPLTVLRHGIADSCGPDSCPVRVTVRNDTQRVVYPRLEAFFFADAARDRYISGCAGALPAAAPGATVSGGCTVNDANWRRWVYVEQPSSVYYSVLIVPRVTSANPPRQPTP